MQVSWYEWILPFPYWDFTIRTFICPFFQHIFCHNSMTAWHIDVNLGCRHYLHDKSSVKFSFRYLETERAMTQKLTTRIIIIIIIITRATGQGPSGRSHFHICLGKGTGNRAKGLERVDIDFLFNFNGNHGPICKRFQVTACEICLTSILTFSRSL